MSTDDEKLFNELMASFDTLEQNNLQRKVDSRKLFSSRRSTIRAMRFPGMAPVEDIEPVSSRPRSGHRKADGHKP